jgi:hypothetical protein
MSETIDYLLFIAHEDNVRDIKTSFCIKPDGTVEGDMDANEAARQMHSFGCGPANPELQPLIVFDVDDTLFVIRRSGEVSINGVKQNGRLAEFGRALAAV